jgi:hypothetical protein
MIDSAVIRLLITLNSLADNKASEPRRLEKRSVPCHDTFLQNTTMYLAPLSRLAQDWL